MENENKIKLIVKEKYSEIAGSTEKCGCSCNCGSEPTNINMLNEDYYELDGYVADADLGLGCGLPTRYSEIKEGDIVVDLGSGAGNDVFIARSLVGEAGKIIGVDMTEAMIEKANKNLSKTGYGNIEFRLGEIENLPVDSNSVDVVISNCVLNLVPDKQKAFSEIYRILKIGGHFSISDIVTEGELPASIKKSAEMYAGCVAGAISRDEYLNLISETGFKAVEIKKSDRILMPLNILKAFLTEEEIDKYEKSGVGIFSVTVNAVKNL
jgi:ubiquinone/menaquinone biosynthesis C-methylase UbiE